MILSKTMTMFEYQAMFEKIKKEKKPVEVVKSKYGYSVNLKGTDQIIEDFPGYDIAPAVQFCLFHKLSYTVNIPNPSGPGYMTKN